MSRCLVKNNYLSLRKKGEISLIIQGHLKIDIFIIVVKKHIVMEL